jgi:GMP synthase (glutamine-hydrolysing)
VPSAPRVLVLQHASCEPPGAFEDVLVARGASIDRVELDLGEPLPSSLSGVDAIVAMGGPMSVNDEDEHPWLVDEKRLIGAAVRAGVPFWGCCLGAQLLAAALDARVYPADPPEVGVLSIDPTAAGRGDPVLGPCAWPLDALQWHGETFDLPAEAVLLGSSDACERQAFRWGRSAYGIQFHIEAGPDMVREWAALPDYAASAQSALGPGGRARLVAAVRAASAAMHAEATALFTRWLDLWAPAPTAAT